MTRRHPAQKVHAIDGLVAGVSRGREVLDEGELERLGDPALVEAVLRYSPEPERRVEAVQLVDVPLLLESVADSDEDYRVRRAAVRRIEDSGTLTRIARSARHEDTRRCAVEKLADRTVLEEIARSDAPYAIRMAAVWRYVEISEHGIEGPGRPEI